MYLHKNNDLPSSPFVVLYPPGGSVLDSVVSGNVYVLVNDAENIVMETLDPASKRGPIVVLVLVVVGTEAVVRVAIVDEEELELVG